MRTNTVPSCYLSYPLRDLFGVVDEEQAVVHAWEDFDVGLRTEGQEVFHLRFGDKGFFGAVGSSLCLPQHHIEKYHEENVGCFIIHPTEPDLFLYDGRYY